MRFSRFIIWLSLMLMAAPAFGQAVVLRPDDVLPRLKEAAPEAFYINGHDVHGMTDEMANGWYELGDTSNLLLAMVTLRLADKGIIDLNAPVAKDLPDILEFNPFEVAITVKHLLSETAGFAQPAVSLHEPQQYRIGPNEPFEQGMANPLKWTKALPAQTSVKPFAIKARGAGQITNSDPVGWIILIRLLEQKSGKKIGDLLQEEVMAPLGMRPSDLILEQSNFAPVYIYSHLSRASMYGRAFKGVALALAQNKQSDNGDYLLPSNYALLTNEPLWQLHPMRGTAFAGNQLVTHENRQATTPRTTSMIQVEDFITRSPGSRIFFFPHEGSTFVLLNPPSNYTDPRRFQDAVWQIAKDHFPPKVDTKAFEAAEALAYPSQIGDRFECAEATAWLQLRIATAQHCFLHVGQQGVGTLNIRGHSPEPESNFNGTYKEVAPYYYQHTATGEPLAFSRYKAGGYALLGEQYYVRVGMLGYFRSIVGNYVPLMIVILLTGALHIRSKTSVQWRRYGGFCLAGATLVGLGLYADWFWWPTVLYELQMPWLVTLWRTGLNVGLMLMLALPMLSMTFIRQQNMPEKGFALLFAGPHLGLISLAAIGLFLTTIIWGMAGTFTAY